MAISTKEEIKAMVWSLHPLKSPVPYGFPCAFFRSYWPIVKDQDCSLVQECFRARIVLKSLAVRLKKFSERLILPNRGAFVEVSG